ncbi:hypothetical protein Pmani_005926 [Petrolisthes manimaculis]|uniref:Uncharacterized protein n=1 Tax=Petrolisthes manimaculis TaxID=1843537 RepID=A0AAE1UH08_9EUCA|nr:hypothetical protein Pmani_015955 [Petrolisthes manimaculis]KAK4323372.1 hypothetical protein Pmani_005926 [Petrolisthes manimaculis]
MALHKGRFLWYENLKPRSYIEETSCCGTQGQTTQEILYVFYSEWDRPVNMSRAYLDGTNVMVFSSVLLDWLYVTDWRRDAILCMNKTDGSQERVVAEVAESNRLYGIRIYSVSAQDIAPQQPCHDTDN